MFLLTNSIPVFLLFLQYTFAENVSLHRNWKLVNNEKCGIGMSSDRITAGSNATIGQFPWMAYLEYTVITNSSTELKLGCGGSLINERYVLTAGHCLKHKFSDGRYQSYPLARIILGQNYVGVKSCSGAICAAEPQTMYPDTILTHKDFAEKYKKNDIGLIRLKEAAVFNGWVMPICLPGDSLVNKSYVGSQLIVAGWGRYCDEKDPSLPSNVLRYVSVPVLDIEECKSAYEFGIINEDLQLCAGERFKDACHGDSGGPLMGHEELHHESRIHLIGVVSHGKTCGSKDWAPGVYARITHSLPWILDNIRP